MTFVAENTFMWQKLAVELDLMESVESVAELLRNGAMILLIRFGLHTREENLRLLDLANDAIGMHGSQIAPWKLNVGIACELSGLTPRVKFCRQQGPIELSTMQKIFLTSNPMYEDKRSSKVLFITGLEPYLVHIQRGDSIIIGQAKLKVCKVQAKFVECCVQSPQDDATTLLLHPFDKVQLNQANSEKKIDDRIKDECSYALTRNCRFVIIPDLDSYEIFHSVDCILQDLEEKIEASVHILARFMPETSPTVIQNVLKHLSGVLTNDPSMMPFCRSKCKSILYEMKNLEQFPDPEVARCVDMFITKPSTLQTLKDKLRELNQNSIVHTSVHNLAVSKKSSVFTKCIEYASKHCQANAVIMCTLKTACDAVRLSSKNLPCPVLVTTSDDKVIQHLMLRKYCFPVYVPEGITSTRLLIKYATIYGRRFGYLKPGNATVTGFGEDCVKGLELRYVPDDFMLLFQ